MPNKKRRHVKKKKFQTMVKQSRHGLLPIAKFGKETLPKLQLITPINGGALRSPQRSVVAKRLIKSLILNKPTTSILALEEGARNADNYLAGIDDTVGNIGPHLENYKKQIAVFENELKKYSENKQVSNELIDSAYRLCAYALWISNPPIAKMAGNPLYLLDLKDEEYSDIRQIIDWVLNFLNSKGGVLSCDMAFNPPKRSDKVTRGYGDFLTKDGTLWDLHISSMTFSKDDTLRVLGHYLMCEDHYLADEDMAAEIDGKIIHLGVVNPLSGNVYVTDVKGISPITKMKAENRLFSH